MREAVEHVLHAGARGIVFDLRGNGGGLVEEAQLIASIFIPKGVIVTTRGRTQPTQVLLATGDAIPASIPMVVLVDSNTASSAEIVTAALQDHHRATVVGTHTFGKGVFQEEQPLSNGGALDITVGEYFTPNGRNLGGGGVKQGAGVVPEVPVPSNGVDTDRGLDVALSTLAAKVEVSPSGLARAQLERGGQGLARGSRRGVGGPAPAGALVAVARASRALPDRRAAVPAAGARPGAPGRPVAAPRSALDARARSRRRAGGIERRRRRARARAERRARRWSGARVVARARAPGRRPRT